MTGDNDTPANTESTGSAPSSSAQQENTEQKKLKTDRPSPLARFKKFLSCFAARVTTCKLSSPKHLLIASSVLLFVVLSVAVTVAYWKIIMLEQKQTFTNKKQMAFEHTTKQQLQSLNSSIAAQKTLANQLQANTQKINTFNDQLQSLHSQQAQLASSITQLQTTSAQMHNALKKNHLDASVIQQRLDDHNQRLNKLTGNNRDDWYLSEARYLLRMAQQRLLIERSTDGAQSLLRSADNTLAYVGNQDIQTIRDAINSELLALRATPQVDRQSLYRALTEVKLTIQALPVSPAREILDTLDDSEEPSTAAQHSPLNEGDSKSSQHAWYQTMYHSIKATLATFIHVRANDQTRNLLLTHHQHTQLINSLVLMIEQARFAVLHEETAIYKTSLTQAIDWWQQHFFHHGQYRELLDQLRKLHRRNIIQEKPLIDRSSSLLDDYIQRHHSHQR